MTEPVGKPFAAEGDGSSRPAEFSRLKRLLTLTGTFQLIIVEFDDPARRDRLIQALSAEKAPGAVIAVHEAAHPTFHELKASLSELVKQCGAVHLVNLEKWLTGAKGEERLKAFNFYRAKLAEDCPGNLILWLTPELVRTFALRAPDMWAWRSAVLDVTDEPVVRGYAPPQQPDISIGRSWSGIPTPERGREIQAHLETAKEELTPDLKARLLWELGLSLRWSGETAAGVAALREALEIYRGLARANPRAHEPVLGSALGDLASLLSGLGEREEALGLFNEALALGRKLAEENPLVHRPSLAGTINNMAVLVGSMDKTGEARRLFQEAISLGEGLARDNPGSFLPDLAWSYYNYGVFLARSGHWAEASSAVARAVVNQAVINAWEPALYGPRLALTLRLAWGLCHEPAFLARREAWLADLAAELSRRVGPEESGRLIRGITSSSRSNPPE
ncbi:MAG: tetratricopeptide repeat protein [Pseudomonadota bacterium]